jgi:hypothetical protein
MRRSPPPTPLEDMPATAAALPRSTRLSALRARRDDVARDVCRCEDQVDRLRSELAVPQVHRLAHAATPPAERAMIGAVRELVAARARLAQVSRELRRAQAV